MSRIGIPLRGINSDQDPLPRTDLEFETTTHEEIEARGDSHRKSFFAGSRKAPRSIRLRAESVSHLEYGRPEFDKPGNWHLLSSASKALLARFKSSRRSGTGGQEFKPRSVTLLRRRNSSPMRSGSNGGRAPSRYFWQTSRPVDESKGYSKDDSPPVPLDQDSRVNDLDADASIQGNDKNQVSNIFDDDTESGVIDTEEETKTSDEQEYRDSERSAWASTLLASTLAKQKAVGKTMTRDLFYLIPRPEQAKNKVEYLIMICKAAKAYASTQAEKLTSLRDGQHIINQLRDVANDLHRQHSKILAVYDAKEVCKSVDRLGETLKNVYELLGNIEDTALMFGKKKRFGMRISALVHDIGTYSNALLVATSLAIADRPNILYITDTCNGEPPASQKEELKRMCIEGDKHFFGRGEGKNLKKEFEAYLWVAERGGVEAMVVLASMYKAGTHAEADREKCHFWLEKAVDKGYAPAMNDLAVVLLGEADRLEEAHPELKCEILSSEILEAGGSNEGDEFLKKIHGGISSLYRGDRPASDLEEDYHQSRDEVGAEMKSSWTPEQERLFEQVMEKRKRAMRLLQEAAQTGHTDAMTNLGNMQEAMGYFDDARNCYSMAAEPSGSANNPRAQNYLGALYFDGRGVTKDLDEAVKWFRRSALQGNAQACKNLGICYQAGLGVAKDQTKAVELFRQAMEGGSVSAANDLAYVLARDALNALAAVARQAPACIHSGSTDLKGEGPPFGTINSGDLTSEASRQVWRDSIAQLREASDLFRCAAESGISDASYQLGMLYQQGLGIPLDPVAAFENFLVAANGSIVHPAAAARVGDMLYSGTGCLRDYREALRYYLRATKAGEPKSANAVGLMYELGRGVSRDSEAALEWYIRAASLGSADGAFNGALLLERGDPVSVIASAAGLTVFPEEHLGASLPPPTPQLPPGGGPGLTSLTRAQEKRFTTDPINAAADSARHVQRTSGDEHGGYQNCEPSRETQQHNHRPGQGEVDDNKNDSDRNQNPHEHETPSAALRCRHNGNNHGDRASAEDGGGSGVEYRRADKCNRRLHPWKLGNRSLALQMFERAAELGHPGAALEIHRVKLREKLNHLERMGKQSHSK